MPFSGSSEWLVFWLEWGVPELKRTFFLTLEVCAFCIFNLAPLVRYFPLTAPAMPWRDQAFAEISAIPVARLEPAM